MPLNVKWLGMNENNDGAMIVRFSINSCGKSAVQSTEFAPIVSFEGV